MTARDLAERFRAARKSSFIGKKDDPPQETFTVFVADADAIQRTLDMVAASTEAWQVTGDGSTMTYDNEAAAREMCGRRGRVQRVLILPAQEREGARDAARTVPVESAPAFSRESPDSRTALQSEPATPSAADDARRLEEIAAEAEVIFKGYRFLGDNDVRELIALARRAMERERQAAAAERERCARIADNRAAESKAMHASLQGIATDESDIGVLKYAAWAGEAERIAAAIREGGTK